MVRLGNKKKIFFFLIIICLVSTTGCLEIKSGYVSDEVLTNGWYENFALRNTGIQFLGLEKWTSSTYEINGNYPSTLTVTTIKALTLKNEDDLFKNIQKTIDETFKNNMNISKNQSGERFLLKNHKTKYLIYDGVDNSSNLKVKIIGEVWNCVESGCSIVCIGVSYLTSKTNPNEHTYNWYKMIMDPVSSIENAKGDQGLIYNTICH